MTETRKLAAILVADVVGYSRLAAADEDRTLVRLRGLRSDLIDPAVAVAKQQGARSLGLQAALSLAKLYQSTSRPADAPAVLAPALEGFAPTNEMPEIAEAQALLVAIEADAHVRHE